MISIRRFSELKKSMIVPVSFAEESVSLRVEMQDGIFLLSDYDVGVVLEVDGIYDEVLTHEELMGELSVYYKFLSRLLLSVFQQGHQLTLQFIHSCRDISEVPASLKPALNRSKNASTSILEKGMDISTSMYRRQLICIRYHEEVKKPWKKQLRTHVVSRLSEQVQRFNDILTMVLSETGLRATRLTSVEVVPFILNMLHAGKTPKDVQIHPDDLQKSFYSPAYEGSNMGLHDETQSIRVMCQHGLPTSIGQGQIRDFLSSMPIRNYDIVVGFSHIKHETGQDLLAKHVWYERAPRYQKQFADIESFSAEVTRQNPYGSASFRVVAYNASEAELSNVKGLASDSMGMRLIKEDLVSVHQIKTSLPLSLTSYNHKIDGRYQTLRLDQLFYFVPFFTGSEMSTGSIPMVNRSLQTVTGFNLFAGVGNKMTTVLGRSGAGKSVLMTQLIVDFLSQHPDAIVRVIDKRTSYEKLCQLLSGRVIEFSKEAFEKVSYSPFAVTDPTESDIMDIYVLICTAITQSNETADITPIHSEILIDAIKLAYNSVHLQRASGYNSDHPIFTNVLESIPLACEAKKKMGITHVDGIRDDLSLWTVNLIQGGKLGFIFAEHERNLSSSTTQDTLMVYDLNGLSDPLLEVLAGQMAFMKISRDLRNYPLSTPKLIIFEELGMLLKGGKKASEQQTEFIQNVVKTCRKMNAQAIAITNEVDDYLTPAGRTFWTTATQRLFLPLGQAMVDALYEHFSSLLSEADIDVLRSLTLEKSKKRSHLYVMSQNDTQPFKGSVFLPLSPWMDALTTTSPTQLALYRKLRDQMTAEEALDYMATNHPYGAHL